MDIFIPTHCTPRPALQAVGTRSAAVATRVSSCRAALRSHAGLSVFEGARSIPPETVALTRLIPPPIMLCHQALPVLLLLVQSDLVKCTPSVSHPFEACSYRGFSHPYHNHLCFLRCSICCHHSWKQPHGSWLVYLSLCPSSQVPGEPRPGPVPS